MERRLCYPGVNAENSSKEDYEDHVRLAGKKGFKGIKGKSFMSEFVNLPTDIIIDDMHLDDEGCTKQFFNLWFLPKHHNAEFYLLKNINQIDKILQKVKYPQEIKKTHRSLTSYLHFNANEFRTIAAYPLIYILKDQFSDLKYYYNLIKYILFLRLLRQDFVSETDIQNSYTLINSFLTEFPDLYGTKNLTYNIHANIHLPNQVRCHGSLHKSNAYPGENCFKEMNRNFQGTSNIPHQIATNISVKNLIENFLTKEVVD